MRLVGTTKPTIAAIRDRSHWNSSNLTPQDPVMLGLCTQIDLDNEVGKAARRLERERKETSKTGTLLPTAETIPGLGPQPELEQPELEQPELEQPEPVKEADGGTPEEEASRVFANLKELSRPADQGD